MKIKAICCVSLIMMIGCVATAQWPHEYWSTQPLGYRLGTVSL